MNKKSHRGYKPPVKRKCIVCGKLSDDIYCSRGCVIQVQIIEFGAPIQQEADDTALQLMRRSD